MASAGVLPGRYYIVSKGDANLAVLYTGQGHPLLVSNHKQVSAQEWVITGSVAMMVAITPGEAQDLRTEPLHNNVVSDQTNYEWLIVGDEIRTMDQKLRWAVEKAEAGQPVVLSPETGDDKQKWNFIKAE